MPYQLAWTLALPNFSSDQPIVLPQGYIALLARDFEGSRYSFGRNIGPDQNVIALFDHRGEVVATIPLSPAGISGLCAASGRRDLIVAASDQQHTPQSQVIARIASDGRIAWRWQRKVPANGNAFLSNTTIDHQGNCLIALADGIWAFGSNGHAVRKLARPISAMGAVLLVTPSGEMILTEHSATGAKSTCFSATGQFQWTVPLESLRRLPAVSTDGTFRVLTSRGLTAINNRGQVAWEVPISLPTERRDYGLACLPNGVSAIAAGKHLTAVSAAGEIVWSHEASGLGENPHFRIASSADGFLYAIPSSAAVILTVAPTGKLLPALNLTTWVPGLNVSGFAVGESSLVLTLVPSAGQVNRSPALAHIDLKQMPKR